MKEKCNNKEFKRKIKDIYAEYKTPGEKRRELGVFYDTHLMSEDALYKRYRRLKYQCEVEGQTCTGAFFGALVSGGFYYLQSLPSQNELLIEGHLFISMMIMVVAVAIAGALLAIPFLAMIDFMTLWHVRTFMGENSLLVYPYEIRILEGLLKINSADSVDHSTNIEN